MVRQLQDFDGTDVIDADGDQIGTVERTFDDDAGTARFVEVSMGSLFTKKHRLVPVDEASLTDEGLKVPYSKQIIADSPDASTLNDTLTGDLLDQVTSYYTGAGTPTPEQETESGETEETSETAETAGQKATGSADTTETDQPDLGQVRDLGDVVEVPIVEEQLVKQPVVKEVLRIRKTQVSEPQTVEADVRKEDVDVSQEGDVAVHNNQSGSS